MSHARNVFAVAVLAALAWAVVPVAEAQAPIRIGVTLAETGEQALPDGTGARYAENTYPVVEVNRDVISTTRPSQIAVAS